MKKQFSCIAGIVVLCVILLSCKDKNDKNAITPDYGATGNPYPNNQTVTGSTTYTNPATKNSSINVGDIGWSNPSCISTSSLALRATKGSTDVMLTFASAITSGTYAIATNASQSSCVLTLLNAPDQPAGLYWYGKSGSVVVTTTSTSINASLVSVICTQKDFNFPQVSLTGGLACYSQ
jgi:hypothetical protein